MPRTHEQLAARAEALLHDPATTAFAWRSLAAGWLAIGERDAAIDYLAHARACATTCEEWCDLVEGFVEAELPFDELLARAVELEHGAWWHVAYVEGSDAAMIRGRAAATTFADLHALCCDDLEILEREMPRLEQLAVTCRDWLALLRIAHLRYELADEARCAERAIALAPDEDSRHLALYRRYEWIAGYELVAPPPRMRPEEILDGRGRTPPGWRADAGRLFRRLCTEVTAEQLLAIANNDYGYNAIAYDDLAQIDDSHTIAHPIVASHEELELERWHSGPETDHLARAYACCILCIDVAGPSTGDLMGGNAESAVPTLLESCLALGPDYVAGARDLFLAMADTTSGARLFIELGAYLAACACDPDDPRLARYLARLVADEALVGNTMADASPYNRSFVLRTSNFTQRYHVFHEIAAAVAPHLADRLRPTEQP